MSQSPDRPLPYYRWYVTDYRASRTYRKLNWEMRGIFRELLDECWTEGAVPDDAERLSELLDVPLGIMAEAWKTLRPLFVPILDGMYLSHPRLESERTASDKVRTARRLAGSKGGATPKQKKTNGSKSKAIAKQMTYSRAEQSNSKAEQRKDQKILSGSAQKVVVAEDLLGFELFWSEYPQRPGASKAGSLKAWMARIKDGTKPDTMIQGAKDYSAYVTIERTEPKYIKQPETFLGPDKHFASDWTPKASATGKKSPAEIRKLQGFT